LAGIRGLGKLPVGGDGVAKVRVAREGIQAISVCVDIW
jgi:hypothetical protein